MSTPLLLLLLHLGLPSAPQNAARPLQFIGFAYNESATAWRITRQQRYADGSQDSYALVRLLGVGKQEVLANFIERPLRHRPAAGRPPASPQELRRRHPDYYNAASYAAWKGARRSGRFAAITHEFKDVVVRLGADKDSPLTAAADDKKFLKVRAKGPGPLGYSAICRLFEGEMIVLGHFRQEAAGHSPLGEPLQAELHVYYSHTGRLIAVVNTFLGARGEVGPTEAAVLLTPEDDPIGATGVGMLQMVENQSRSFYNDYRHMHPRRAETYRQYVGKWF